MNEMQFGNKIRHILNGGLQLDEARATRLARARMQALDRLRPQPAAALAWADNVLGQLGGWGGVSLRLVAPVIALAIGFAAIYTWQQNQRAVEIEELDAQLLTDDLPIDAYLDRSFQNWLKKRLAEQ
jgi:hypothetical protein